MEITTEKNISAKSKLEFKFYNSKTFTPLLQLLSDNVSFFIGFLVFYYFIFESGAIAKRGQPDFNLFLLAAIFLNIYWTLIFFIANLYKNWYERSPFDEIFLVFKSTLIGSFLIFFMVILDTQKSARLMAVYYFINMFIGISISRTVVRRFQHYLRSNRFINYNTFIIGSLESVSKAKTEMNYSTIWALRPVGEFIIQDFKNSDIVKIEEFIKNTNPDVVVFVDSELNHNSLFRLINFCSDRKIRTKIEPDLYSIFTGQSKVHNIYGMPYIEINPKIISNWERFIKRVFDVTFSFIILLLGLPIWILTAIAIKIDSKGPIFYKQRRIGQNNKEFIIWKFRSMTHSNTNKQSWTIVNDPRVTKVGKFIRKTHIDEFPQFWNVIKGDMSVVGPRPEQPKFVEEFEKIYPYYSRRHIVKPGITGWWQIKYKNYQLTDSEIENRLKDDFYYIENMSLKFDIEIVIRTVWSVISGHGQS